MLLVLNHSSFCRIPRDGGGGNSHIEVTGMIVVPSSYGLKFVVWYPFNRMLKAKMTSARSMVVSFRVLNQEKKKERK